MKTSLLTAALASGLIGCAGVAFAQQAPITSPGEQPKTLERDSSGTPGTGSQKVPPGGAPGPSASPVQGAAPMGAPATTGSAAPVARPAIQDQTLRRDQSGTPGTGHSKNQPAPGGSPAK